MSAEFKIGRLRFTWEGPWQTNTSYIKDAIVSYEGKTYVCLIANTSSATSFYDDLYYITPSGASTPLWQLIIDGKTFVGQWTNNSNLSWQNSSITVPASTSWTGIANNGTTWVALAQSGATTYSSNGTAWASGVDLSQLTSATWLDITYDSASGYFVAVGQAGSGNSFSAYSNTGQTWSLGGSMGLSAGQFISVISSQTGLYASVAYGTRTVSTSNNYGLTWATHSLPSVQNWTGVAYGNGTFVAVSGGVANSTAAAYSTNGSAWVASTLPQNVQWNGITYGNGVFLAIAAGGQTATSTNGKIWTNTTSSILTNVQGGAWQNVRFGNGIFIAVNEQVSAGQTAATSVDGVNWILQPLPNSGNWLDSSYNSSNDTWAIINGGANATSNEFAIVNITLTKTTYSLGNIVIYGGQLYYCNTAHTSADFAAQATYWSEYTQFTNWHVTWATNTNYGLGDVVKYGGIIYKCIANHTSAATSALGLEANQSAWNIFYPGINYVGTWTSNTRYRQNDLVKLGDNIYQCVNYNTDSSFVPANWTIFLPGLEYAPSNPWSAGTIYQLGDTVEYGGYTYIGKTTNNTGNTPSSSPTNWSLFTQGFSFQSEWSSVTSYIIGSVVHRHGMLYSATANNSSQDPAATAVSTTYVSNSGNTVVVANAAGIVPGMNVLGNGFSQGQTVVSTAGTNITLSAPPDSTAILTVSQVLNFVGVNYAYWTLLIPGAYWTKTWVNNTFYTVGDITVWQNGTYICIQSHTSYYAASQGANNNNRPDTDTSNTYWVFYVTHARKNAMNTIGDLEYYSSSTSGYQALPLGTSSYILRDYNNTPTWSKINVINNVFYVSNSNGVDQPTYGSSWDQPFKTISYACNLVAQGINLPNTRSLIVANKAWMLAEMIQWTNYQINTANAPYYYLYNAYSLNSSKATRDAGLIIDAIAYDLGRGGNSQTIAAALSYFAFGQNNEFISQAVTADVPYYLPMLNELASLLSNAIGQTTPSTSYQIANGITPVIYQTTGLSPSELNLTAGINGLASATTLLNYIITSLSTESTYALPPANTGITCTIFVKTGTYPEKLPISVPENTAIVGDELRGVIVEPAVSIQTTATSSNSVSNTFTVLNLRAMADQMTVMFADPSVQDSIGNSYSGFGGIVIGQKYYAVGSTINQQTNTFSITSLTGSLTYISSYSVATIGTGATFTVSPNSNGTYNLSVSYGGTGYAIGDTLIIPGGLVSAPTIAATALVQGTTYTIVSLGTTNFTLCGARTNAIGTVFTATSVQGLGTGVVSLSVNDINITVTGVLNTAITTVSNTGSTIVQLTSFNGGTMTVYAGDCLSDMFRLRNGTGLRNMTLVGLQGTLSSIDSYLIQRPTGGSFACLDPGIGPDDTSVWIFRRSPYVQNVSAFGNGCTGYKVDGTLHNGGNKSIVTNDFTHIINDGIGIWCTGPGALTEAVSVFSYYGYAGYFAEAGGRIRATNGNSSYGTYGVIAEGYDITETPATGIVFNQSTQVQAQVQSSYGSQAQLLRLSYANAGSAYYTPTTNLLYYSNNFIGSSWSNDGNLSFAKNTVSLTGNTEAWTMTGLTSGPDGSYVYQNISLPAAGQTYTNVSALNLSGAGTNATFNVTVTSTSYVVTVNNAGSGYVSGNQVYISGGQLGGVNNINDCLITVTGLSGSAILAVTASGTVPTNSNLNYTLSVYIKAGTAPSVDLYGIFSGSQSVSSSVNYNFSTGVVSSNLSGPISGTSIGYVPVSFGASNQAISTTGNTVSWYRLYLTINDITGLNTNLQFRIYPRGFNGTAGQYNYFYGAQVEVSKATGKPNFYQEVTGTTRYTVYANYNITGAGTGAITVGEETRSASVFQTYITTDANSVTGGAGYLTASNNAQSGNNQFIQLAQSDISTNANYTGMRVFVQSGTGAGQYGYISYFDSRTTGATPKYAYVLKESFTSLQITSTSLNAGYFTLNPLLNNNVSTLYLNQPVQFIPTYYNTIITSTNLATTTVTQAVGGTSNYFTVGSVSGLTVNMGVTFSAGNGQALFSDIIGTYVYYINSINPVINGVQTTNTIQISSSYAGPVYDLNSASGTMTLNYIANNNYLQASTTNMVVNYPIQFTGNTLGGLADSTVYYISDIIDTNDFTLSTTLVSVTVTATTAGTNTLTVSSTGGTTSLVPLNPIVFTNTVFDVVTDSTKYYISNVVNSTQFTIATSLITVNLTATSTHANGDLLTVDSTSGFIANQPINFVGTTWEPNIISGTVYYISAINGVAGVTTTFTISQTPGGNPIFMSGGSGLMTARTCGTSVSLSGTTGSMVGTSTNAPKTLSLSSSGNMTATFSTQLFGGVTLGTTYYVQSIPSSTGTTFAVSTSPGTASGTSTSASPINLVAKTGSMNVAAVGWDHINPGTQIQSVLDNTSVYYIEPRLNYASPNFGQSVYTSAVSLSGGINWSNMAFGNNHWVAIPSGGQTGAVSTDGQTWTSITLPTSQQWTGIAFGNGYFVAISGGAVSGSNVVVVSIANGAGWRSYSLPSTANWTNIAYGNGIFVAIAKGTNNAAYSTNFGVTWTSATLPANTTWTGLAYGDGIFVAIASGGTTAAYSSNGSTWTSATLPSSTAWSSIAFGQGVFVAVSSSTSTTAYSQTGTSWYSSNIAIAATSVVYGQGVFTALNASSSIAYTTEDCLMWIQQSVASTTYNAVSFGFTANNIGTISTLSGQNAGSIITAGCKTKGRPIVTSGVMQSVNEWEPGSGYITSAGSTSLIPPTITVTDPNVTTNVVFNARTGNGVLSSPTFYNKGNGYNTNSTVVLITGSGYADQYQIGLQIILNNLSRLPSPGDNLTITGVSQIYKVTSAYPVYGTSVPNLEANVSVSPAISTANATANGTAINIRTKYSQARLTNHDFLYIGSGDLIYSQYPSTSDALSYPNNQTVEANYGRVFYTSTDQDGNFKVGSLFGVQQATGIVTLSASQFGLTGLNSLSLGGISVGGSSVIITQFSTDNTFSANSDSVIPTQKAIKSYLTSRLSQGGANTFTGQLTAGTIIVGGPNYIKSTIPNGVTGSNIKMVNKVYFKGSSGYSTVDGNMAILDYFIRSGNHRSNTK